MVGINLVYRRSGFRVMARYPRAIHKVRLGRKLEIKNITCFGAQIAQSPSFSKHAFQTNLAYTCSPGLPVLFTVSSCNQQQQKGQPCLHISGTPTPQNSNLGRAKWSIWHMLKALAHSTAHCNKSWAIRLSKLSRGKTIHCRQLECFLLSMHPCNGWESCGSASYDALWVSTAKKLLFPMGLNCVLYPGMPGKKAG